MLETVIKLAIGLLGLSPSFFFLLLAGVARNFSLEVYRKPISTAVIISIIVCLLQIFAVQALRVIVRLYAENANYDKVEDLSTVFGIAGIIILPVLLISGFKR